MDSRLHNSRRGLTMIEVMIVVILLAITAAVAMPMVGDRSGLKLSAASRVIVADLQYAQNLAVATRQNVYVKFEADQYTLCKRDGTTLVALTHPVERGTYVTRFNANGAAALNGVSLALPSFGGETVLGFDSLGAPFIYNETTATRGTMVGQGVLTLACRGQTQLIHVEPYTGELTIP